MLNIDESKLEILLLNRKKRIENPKYNGIGEIVSSISIMITLCLSDYKQVSIMKPLHFKIGAWILACGILLFGIYTFVKSVVNFYSIDTLYKEITDLDPNIEHPFNIILIKNNEKSGKYLLFKSKRWSCWLFPNYHCLKNFNQEEEIINIKKYLKRDLNISENVTVKYIGNEISSKFSVPDKIEKKYNFHYFVVTNINFLQFDKKRKFRFNGKKYCWKTLDKMYANKNMLKKNSDVLDYVRRKCEIN